jgi:hypothetical protein
MDEGGWKVNACRTATRLFHPISGTPLRTLSTSPGRQHLDLARLNT